MKSKAKSLSLLPLREVCQSIPNSRKGGEDVEAPEGSISAGKSVPNFSESLILREIIVHSQVV